jgi:hypothetical protein
MSPPWILRRLANVSPFFNSPSNRLRITNYCLRSVSSSLLKFTRFIQGKNIAWTNLDMIRNLQHLQMNKKSYTYKTLPFNSHWIFFWIKKCHVVWVITTIVNHWWQMSSRENKVQCWSIDCGGVGHTLL